MAAELDSRYSWFVATVGAVAMVFTFGTPLSYGILRAPVSDAFGVEPVALSTVFSLMLFMMFIGSGIVGVFAVRLPARRVLLTAALASALLTPSLFVVSGYLGLLVVFGTLGLTLGTAFVLVASVVPRWFDRHRGTATGLIFVGNGLGLFLFPPLWQVAIESLGIRRAFLVIMGATTAAFLAVGLVCRRPDWQAESAISLGELLSWVRQLLATRSFQLLFVGIGLAFAWYHLLAAYAVDLFRARGLSAVAASFGFGLVGGVSIISRIGSGYLADSIGPRRAFLGSLGCASVGSLLLATPWLAAVALGVVLLGLGLGGCATLYIPLLLEVYPPAKDTAVIGIFNIAAGIGSLAMPPLGTAAIAHTAGYTAAVVLTWAVTVGGLVFVVAGLNRA